MIAAQRRLFAAGACFAAVLFAAARADDAKPAKLTGDLAKLQGDWKTTLGPNNDVELFLKIEGNVVSVKVKTPEDTEFDLKGEIKLDDKAKLKTIDWLKFTGPNGDAAPDNLGIYEFQGEDVHVCNGGPGNQRPTEFKTGDGGNPHEFVLKRVKDQPKAESAQQSKQAEQ